ncbi:TPA: hypothetical protein DIS56_00590 [Candidatus Saccharibacteria bacterium]|nr:MAG: hypothetical protein A3F05_01080 [Candidatus Saccharibacteria bacterium RIFCSPHIGHO2_12_FULL_47_17]HCM51621.1 hypothetical protein [Candidatus Saccharibacteria bacterium]
MAEVFTDTPPPLGLGYELESSLVSRFPELVAGLAVEEVMHLPGDRNPPRTLNLYGFTHFVNPKSPYGTMHPLAAHIHGPRTLGCPILQNYLFLMLDWLLV